MTCYPHPPEPGSDHIVITLLGGKHQVSNRFAVQIILNQLIQFFPQWERTALRRIGAFLGLVFQAGNWSQPSLCQPENISHPVLIRSLCQAVSSALSSDTLQIPAVNQELDDAFQVLL